MLPSAEQETSQIRLKEQFIDNVLNMPEKNGNRQTIQINQL